MVFFFTPPGNQIYNVFFYPFLERGEGALVASCTLSLCLLELSPRPWPKSFGELGPHVQDVFIMEAGGYFLPPRDARDMTGDSQSVGDSDVEHDGHRTIVQRLQYAHTYPHKHTHTHTTKWNLIGGFRRTSNCSLLWKTDVSSLE